MSSPERGEIIEKLRAYGERLKETLVACQDCGLPYSDFGHDTVLPDEQWLMINPEGHAGILCANCMVRRAAKLDRFVRARMVFE